MGITYQDLYKDFKETYTRYFIFRFGSLCSTTSASVIRNEIEKAALNGNKVCLNMKRVKSITQSYIGELFVELQNKYGSKWVKENIKIIANRDIKESIRKELRGEK